MIYKKGVWFRRLGRKIKRLYYQCLGWVGDKLFTLLRCLRFMPKITPFSQENIKRILIIRLDRIGDVVLSTPTFRAIREHFPKAQITLLVRSYTKDLVVDNPHISELIIFEDKIPFFIEVIKKVSVLIKYKFNLVIVLHPNFWVNFLAFASSAEFRVGYDAAGSGFFLTTKVIDTRAARLRHEVEVNLDLVRTIGIDTNNKSLEVSAIAEEERLADDFLKNNNINCHNFLVAIHPGGYYHYTHWSTQGFAKVSDFLIEKCDARVVIVGTSSERSLAEKVASLMKNRPIIVAGKTSLTQLISLLKRCRLFIGNSSGPMHIACALKVPVVAIFGNIHPTDSYRNWGPWGEGHIVVSKNLNCPDCNPADCLSLECMKLITPEDVCKAAEKQLNKLI